MELVRRELAEEGFTDEESRQLKTADAIVIHTNERSYCASRD